MSAAKQTLSHREGGGDGDEVLHHAASYCGIDLHARRMYICVLDAEGQIRVHRNGPATPEHFLTTVAAYREDLVVAVECIFTFISSCRRVAVLESEEPSPRVLFMRDVEGPVRAPTTDHGADHGAGKEPKR